MLSFSSSPKVAARHGGEISVESVRGQGSTFSILAAVVLLSAETRANLKQISGVVFRSLVVTQSYMRHTCASGVVLPYKMHSVSQDLWPIQPLGVMCSH